MALNRKTFKKVAGDAPSGNLPSGYFNTVLYTGNGGTQRIGGYINRAALFNGSSSNITIPINKLTNTFSFSVWLYLDDLSTSYRWVFGNWYATTQDLYVMIRDTGQIEVNPDGTNGTVVFGSSGIFTTNTWHHLVVSMDAGTYTVYLNDSNLGSGSTTNTTFDNGYDYQIGKVPNSSINEWSGKMDQFRLFNKGLSSTEVTTLYGETFASASKSVTDIFNDSSGVALYQLDGNANDTGGVSGKFGEGAIFNGSSSIIKNTSLGTDYRGQTTLSLSAWFKTSASSGRMTIVSFSATGDGSTDLFLGLDTNTVGFRSINDNTNQVQAENISGTSVRDGDWHHVVFTADSNGNKLYVDGSQITVNYDIGSSSSTIVMPSDLNQFNIGGNQDSGGNQWYWNGIIDEVRIYSDVLTLTEVGYIYNNTTASIPTDNLEAYYKLNGVARDEQQLYDGTATNVTYAYNGTASNVTYQEATNFTPDLVWIKARSTNYDHQIHDSIRGAGLGLLPNDTSAEFNYGTVDSFDSNGFTVDASSYIGTNASNQTFAAWCFNAGTDAAATNNDGTISSTVKANQDAGFSIVKGTSISSGAFSVGHGLSASPELYIIKNTSGTGGWLTYVQSLGADKFLSLHDSAAAGTSTLFWNNTHPTSTVFSMYAGQVISGNANFIAYCFHSVDGIQKVGAYTGNGSTNGTIVETEFEPAWLMIKKTNGTGSWYMYDNKRTTSNPRNIILQANESAVEGGTSYSHLDFLSNGFQLKTTNAEFNGSSDTYIYLAIAADPDTTTPTVENSFDVVTYTGNGGTQSIDTDFKPDFVWIKDRGASYHHILQDSVRGVNSKLASDGTYEENNSAELSLSYGQITSFDSNGFTLGNGTTQTNTNGNSYVAWCWKAGDHDDNLPQINTEGSIDSVVSVNDAAGFSIVKYTGTGSDATIGHGLSSSPQIIFVKRLDTSAEWVVGETVANDFTKVMHLNTSAASSSATYFNNTDPTSSVFSVRGASAATGAAGNFIAYCFTSITGYQKIGSYTGTGTTSSFTGFGFQPRWIIIKRTDSTGNWWIFDSARGNNKGIRANLNNAEDTVDADANTYEFRINFISDGFQYEIDNSTAAQPDLNASNGNYIYLAIK